MLIFKSNEYQFIRAKNQEISSKKSGNIRKILTEKKETGLSTFLECFNCVGADAQQGGL